MLNRYKYLLWVFLTLPSFGQNIDVSRVRGVGYVSDESFLTLPAACTSAVSQGLSLQISKSWTALTTQSLACSLTFVTGGKIQPTSGQTVTLANCPQAGSFQIFDASAGGLFVLPSKCELLPEYFGAGTAANDSPAFNAMIATAKASNPPNPVTLRCTTYNTNTAVSGAVLNIANVNGLVIAGVPGCTRIQTTATTADVIQAINISGNPTYTLSGFSVICPGANTGNGIMIGGAATSVVHISNVVASGCVNSSLAVTGEISGAAGIYVSNAEKSDIIAIVTTNNTLGFRGDNNLNTTFINNLNSNSNGTGFALYNSTGDNISADIESNTGRGSLFSNVSNSIIQIHQENNNMGHTAGLGTLENNCVTGGASVGNNFLGSTLLSAGADIEKFLASKSGSCANTGQFTEGSFTGMSGGADVTAAACSWTFMNSIGSAQVTGLASFFPDASTSGMISPCQTGTVANPLYNSAQFLTSGLYFNGAGNPCISFNGVSVDCFVPGGTNAGTSTAPSTTSCGSGQGVGQGDQSTGYFFGTWTPGACADFVLTFPVAAAHLWICSPIQDNNATPNVLIWQFGDTTHAHFKGSIAGAGDSLVWSGCAPR